MKEAILKNVAISTGKHIPVLESLFNKVAGHQVFSLKFCNFFKNTYFDEHLRTYSDIQIFVKTFSKFVWIYVHDIYHV